MTVKLQQSSQRLGAAAYLYEGSSQSEPRESQSTLRCLLSDSKQQAYGRKYRRGRNNEGLKTWTYIW